MNKKVEELFDRISPSQINLKSFEEKDELQSDIWTTNGIRPAIRKRLLEIAQEFIDGLEIDWVYPKDIVVVGSIAGYNWSKYSDIDLHIIYDFNEIGSRRNVTKRYLDALKNEWNNNHSELNIKGYTVELYVQDADEINGSDGVYSLKDDRWLKMPHLHNYELNRELICNQASKLVNLIMDIDRRVDETDDDYDLTNLETEINVLYKFITKGRKDGLKTDGESSPENIVFKVLRRSGHLGRLRDLKNYIYDKINSL